MKIRFFIIIFLCVSWNAWAEGSANLQPSEPSIPEKAVQSAPAQPVQMLNPSEIGKIEILAAYSQIQNEKINFSGENLHQAAQNLDSIVKDVETNLQNSNEQINDKTNISSENAQAVNGKQTNPVETNSIKRDFVPFKQDPGKQKETMKLPDKLENLVQFLSERESTLEKSDVNPLNEKADLKKDLGWDYSNPDPDQVVVLDSVNYTREIRGIHYLMNPPGRFHPWMKWLLYTNRLSPEMLQAYYAAVTKSENLYKLAMKSKGKLKIRYRGKIMDMPLYFWPDQADGNYELVMTPLVNRSLKNPSSLTSDNLPK